MLNQTIIAGSEWYFSVPTFYS